MHDIMEDVPIAIIPDVPSWSENFAIACFDPRQNIHIFIHIGRWRQDPRLWRELFFISLPDGTTVYRRSVGNALATPNGPGGSNLQIQVIQPFRELVWKYLGATRRVDRVIAQNTLPDDGLLERVQFELRFASDLPVWDLSSATLQSEAVGRAHIEQLGRITGTISVGRETYVIDSIGNRDHSRGPRVVHAAFRHVWLHCVFDNGLQIMVYEFRSMEDGPPEMSEARVWDGSRLYPARFELEFQLPRNGMHQIEKPFEFSLNYAKGNLRISVTAFPSTHFTQITSPWDLYVGRRQVGSELNNCVAEQSALFLLDGDVAGYGHVERSLPGPMIVDPS
jgi:hypothetical protein